MEDFFDLLLEALSHQILKWVTIACVVILPVASALLFDRAVLDKSSYAKTNQVYVTCPPRMQG